MKLQEVQGCREDPPRSCVYGNPAASCRWASLILGWHLPAHPRCTSHRNLRCRSGVGTNTKESSPTAQREGNSQNPTAWLKYKVV